MAVVVFSADEFRGIYSQFSDAETVTDEQLQECFDAAADLIGNTDGKSYFKYDPDNGTKTRKRALYAATCHLATLLYLWPANGQPGRLSSASQGSVSSSFDLLQGNSTTANWWLQTPCGAMLWMWLKPFLLGGRFYTDHHFHPYG